MGASADVPSCVPPVAHHLYSSTTLRDTPTLFHLGHGLLEQGREIRIHQDETVFADPDPLAVHVQDESITESGRLHEHPAAFVEQFTIFTENDRTSVVHGYQYTCVEVEYKVEFFRIDKLERILSHEHPSGTMIPQ